MFRRQRVKTLPRRRAIHAIRVQPLIPNRRLVRVRQLLQHQHATLPPLQRRLHRIPEPHAHLVIDHHAVHYHIHAMLLLRLEFHARCPAQLHQLPVNPRPHESLARQPLQHIAKLALLILHHRREQHHPRPRRQRRDFVHDVTRRLLRDRLPAHRTMRQPDMSEQQPQIIVNLRRRRDDRPRVRPRPALLDRNRRRQPLDVIHLRLLQLIQKLPRVRGQRLHILPLPLRVNRVKRQRRFPRPAQAREHHEFVARDRQREILQVVLPRPANPDKFLRHRQSPFEFFPRRKLLRPRRDGKKHVIEARFVPRPSALLYCAGRAQRRRRFRTRGGQVNCRECRAHRYARRWWKITRHPRTLESGVAAPLCHRSTKRGRARRRRYCTRDTRANHRGPNA